MISEVLSPLSIISSSNVDPVSEDVTRIQDYVDSPDSLFISPNGDTSIMRVETDLEQPTNAISGDQVFRVLVRKVLLSGFSSNTSLGITIYQNGIEIGGRSAAMHDDIVQVTIPESSFLDNSGSGVTIEVECIPYVEKGTFGNQICYLELGALQWDASISEASQTTPPIVTITGISKNRISDEASMNLSTVTFTFDQDVQSYRVMVDGVSHDTGVLAHEFTGTVLANTEVTAEIDHTELSSEGFNRVNIYGQNLDGIWTEYSNQ